MTDATKYIDDEQNAGALQRREERAKSELEIVTERQTFAGHEDYVKSGYADDRDLVNQLIGRVQFAHGLRKLVTVSGLVDLARIKREGLWRALRGKTYELPDGTSETVSSWESFCNFLGRSSRHINEELQNLAQFGEEALAAMNRIGLGYRDLRKLRRLPEDERAVVLGQIKVNVGDRDAIVSLIDDLAAKHAREKESLQKRNAGLQADLDSSRERVAEKNSEIEKLKEQIDRRGRSPIDERAQDLAKRIEGEILGVLGAICGLDAAISQVMEWKDAPQQIVNACHYAVERARTGLLDLRTKYALPEHYEDPDLPWMPETQREKAARHKPQGGGLEAPVLPPPILELTRSELLCPISSSSSLPSEPSRFRRSARQMQHRRYPSATSAE
ncbi:MAG: hypothetical protein ACHBNF_17340 [Chromatiales bacterium]